MPRDPFGIVGKLVRVGTGEYAVRRLVAEGGFGLVYEAEWLDRRRRVALKVLKLGDAIAGGYDAEARARFEQEARLLVELRHPAIIELLAFDHLPSAQQEAPGEAPTPFLVLEWIEGETLDAHVAEHGALAPAEAIALLSPVAQAISFAHSHGVIHRDLKPANLLLGRAIDSLDRPEVPIRVLDFGVARWTSPDAVRTTTTSKTGLSIGYAAPEQYGKEFGPVDGRADQFALAAILYFALTGASPFAGTSLTEVLFATCAATERPSLTRHRKDYAGPLDDVIRKALALRPDDRFEDVESFFRTVEEASRAMASSTPTPRTDESATAPSPVGAPPAVATLPSAMLPARASTSSMAFAPTTRAPSADTLIAAIEREGAQRAPRTRPTGDPSIRTIPLAPDSTPASRASNGGRALLIVALAAAAGAVAYAAIPWLQDGGAPARPSTSAKGLPSTTTRPSISASAAASASASSSTAPVEGCGEIGKDESCIVGGSLHRGPDDCASRGAELDHRAACPRQTVAIATFVLDREEVTQARYAACVAAGKCSAAVVAGVEGDLPARGVRFADAALFCRFDHGKRLPSDDEWELAAAGLEGRTFPWGNARPAATRAVFAAEDARPDGPAIVGSAPAGATTDGVLDLAGNVAEWTSTPAPASAPTPADPEPEAIEDVAVAHSATRRWVRGGSYRSSWDLLRGWAREAYPETLRSPGIGFRCARSVPRARTP